MTQPRFTEKHTTKLNSLDLCLYASYGAISLLAMPFLLLSGGTFAVVGLLAYAYSSFTAFCFVNGEDRCHAEFDSRREKIRSYKPRYLCFPTLTGPFGLLVCVAIYDRDHSGFSFRTCDVESCDD